jgi:pimeloyl-ACP methyl ester carboxylesterase
VIGDVRVHFVHERARSGHGIPLILTNGWPSCFAEFLPLVPRLTDPAAHGIDGPGFDVIIPSLPGYGFSERPARTGVSCRYTAGLWHRLMRGLGYQRYGAHGGDFGSAVTTFMALDNPAPMLGIHLSNLDLAPYTGPGSRPLSTAERAYLAQYQRWRDDDRGYGAIQSTRPQTVSYGLNDSPAGLAAWVLEKWRGRAAHAQRRPLPIRRATRSAQPRHRSLLQRPWRSDQPRMTRTYVRDPPACAGQGRRPTPPRTQTVPGSSGTSPGESGRHCGT